jgi:hypothetical protein
MCMCVRVCVCACPTVQPSPCLEHKTSTKKKNSPNLYFSSNAERRLAATLAQPASWAVARAHTHTHTHTHTQHGSAYCEALSPSIKQTTKRRRPARCRGDRFEPNAKSARGPPHARPRFAWRAGLSLPSCPCATATAARPPAGFSNRHATGRRKRKHRASKTKDKAAPRHLALGRLVCGHEWKASERWRVKGGNARKATVAVRGQPQQRAASDKQKAIARPSTTTDGFAGCTCSLRRLAL